MENPNQDLIRFIDAILHEMEISPHPEEIRLSNLELPFPSNYRNLIKQNKLLLSLKNGAADDSRILGYRKLALFYIIKKPNRKKLLEIRKGLTEFKEIDELPKEKTGKKESSITTLYLNSVGDLWREPKNKYCYPMDENSDRHKIVRYLATHSGYQKTSEIALALEGKDEQTTRKEIGKMRGNIKKFLKINGNDVIESRKESGYRIGPNYRIQTKEEVRH